MSWRRRSVRLTKISNMPNSRELSIIIVNYRSEQYLEKCIASLYNHPEQLRETEIIVVNNDPEKSLAELSGRFPEIKVIQQPKNLGFGAANNRGAAVAQGRYLLFLNPDTEAQPKNLAKMIARLREQEDLAALGPKLIDAQGATQPWCAGRELSFWRLIKNNLGSVDSRKIWEAERTTEADWVSGAALAVQKKAFMEAGGFDEKFFMYFEDEDLCKRLRARGYKILYFPESAVMHRGGRSRKNIWQQKWQYYQSLLRYAAKRITRQYK